MSLFGRKEKAEIARLKQKLAELGYDEYSQVKAAIDAGRQEVAAIESTLADRRQELADAEASLQKLQKQAETATRKIAKSKELYKSIDYAIAQFFDSAPSLDACRLTPADAAAYDELVPTVTMKLHSMDVKALAKAFKENDSQIEAVMNRYADRYTTKANQAIYKLMVIALRAELQNILYELKYEKLDDGIAQVKATTAKYLKIATEGNQSIAGTMTKFVGEIEYLFINAVKIEYDYYVRREQARQEQAAIREKMRQEAAERKKIEAEEAKYQQEIARVQAAMRTAPPSEAEELRKRIVDLESMLAGVVVKKDEITNLQNGKAGTIYIVSNLGSFGDHVFKIGMTRRLDPQERVDELGSASVPFRFDVHSFIFSEDAVALETQLHQRLNQCRVNKVNLRKEFFYSTLPELEALVNELDPAAEFNRTMVAEEFRQSQSTDEVYGIAANEELDND